MSSTSSRSVGKRLPISCQACRIRKIRCARDGRPCQTCVRRGLGAEDCVYLGQPRLSASADHGGLGSDPQMHNELLARIRNLEGLLQRQGGVMSQQSAPPSSGGSVSPGSFSESDGTIAWAPPPPPPPPPSLPEMPMAMGSIGSLQTFPSGYVRYVPMASQWNSSVTKAPYGSEGSQDLDTDVPVDEDDLQIPLTRNGSVSRAELLGVLPPSQYCDTLKNTYLRVFSPLFHILHDLTFEAEYQRFCHDASSVSLSWLSLLFTILSIAVTALDDGDSLLPDLGREKTVSRNIKVLSSRYRSAAMRCLAADGVVSRHTINSLQALVLINYARFHRGLPIWTLLGFTHHVAIAMGCHVDPDRFSLGAIEREERRRAWTGLVILYTVQTSTFGGPEQRFLTQDVKLPADINDVDLLTSMMGQRHHGPTQMTFLLLKLRVHNVSAMISEAIFGFPHRSRMNIPQLETEIINIQETVNARYQLDSSGETPPPNSHHHHLAHLNILYSYIHQLYLLLLRPSLCLYLQGEVTSETCAARLKCAASAKSALTIFHTLADCTQFAPYKWYSSGLGSFHAFHAAVVLSVILANAEDPAEFEEIKEILQKSLDVFATLSNRSRLCSKAVPTLRRIIHVSTACHNLHFGMDTTTSNIGGGGSTTDSKTSSPTLSRTSAMSTSTTTSYFSSSPSSDHEAQMEVLFAQLHPQNWVSAAAVPWDALGSLAGEQKQCSRGHAQAHANIHAHGHQYGQGHQPQHHQVLQPATPG